MNNQISWEIFNCRYCWFMLCCHTFIFIKFRCFAAPSAPIIIAWLICGGLVGDYRRLNLKRRPAFATPLLVFGFVYVLRRR